MYRQLPSSSLMIGTGSGSAARLALVNGAVQLAGIDVKRSWQVSGMDDTVAGIAPLPERARGTAEAAQ